MYKGNPHYYPESINYTEGFLHAYVVKSAEDLGEDPYIGVYIPKIMGYDLDLSNGPSDDTLSIDSGNIINSSKCKVNLGSSVTMANYIKVKPMGFTNMKPPLFAKGETLYVVFIDGDFKHPRYLYNNNNEIKRAIDHLEIYITGKQDGDADIKDTYKVVLSSRDNLLNIHTSKENGEFTTYDFKINTKDGILTIEDGKSNKWELESQNKKWTWVNESSSQIVLNDKNIEAKCDDKFYIECDTFEVKASSDIKETADMNMELKSNSYKNEATTSMENKAPTLTNKVDAMYKCTSPINMFGGLIGGAPIMIAPSVDGGPSNVGISAAGGVFADNPMSVGGAGDKIVPALSILASLCKMPPLAWAIVTPLLPVIPNNKVKF